MEDVVLGLWPCVWTLCLLQFNEGALERISLLTCEYLGMIGSAPLFLVFIVMCLFCSTSLPRQADTKVFSSLFSQITLFELQKKSNVWTWTEASSIIQNAKRTWTEASSIIQNAKWVMRNSRVPLFWPSSKLIGSSNKKRCIVHSTSVSIFSSCREPTTWISIMQHTTLDGSLTCKPESRSGVF
jgi:hypothetical protein